MDRYGIVVVSALLLAAGTAGADDAKDMPGPYAPWCYGPAGGADFFPIAVWVQSPKKAAQYRRAGFNLYVGLWQGPTEEHLQQLAAAGMQVICHLNEVGRRHLEDPTIVGWMHGDEPDNAQWLGEGKGYGPPVPPEEIIEGYERMRATDPHRPILLNLGQGVAWDGWHGRGVRTNHPEDYPEYVKGCDIASFDIYPVTHSNPQVAGQLWYVARGVERLREWTQGRKVVWNCIECTHVKSRESKPTPHQVRAEVWMSLIHGSMGLIYFVHEWEPSFNESALLSDAEMLAAVTALNARIAALAPVLNSPSIADAATVASQDPDVPVALMVKRHGGAAYLFAVAMRAARTRATFTLLGRTGPQPVEVLGEDRMLEARAGVFEDAFEPWDVHLYRIAE